MDKQVRLEIENGHRFVPDVVEAFPGEIQSLSVSKPTLEDVFIHRTGHKFWNKETEKASATEKGERKRRGTRRLGNPMATHTATLPHTTTAPASAGVMLPAFTLWWREVVRFYRQKARVAGVILSPLLFWIVLGLAF